MTVFGKGLSRCLFYTFPQGTWRQRLFFFPSHSPNPPTLSPYTLLITVLGLFSNKRANSYKVGLNNITFFLFSHLWKTGGNAFHSVLRRSGEEILGLLVSNGHIFEKKGKNLFINDWRLLVAEGIVAFPQSWHTPTANTLQIRKQGPRRSLPSAEGHTAKLTWEAFRTRPLPYPWLGAPT